MKQLFLYLWFICMSTLTYAQQVTLSGKVEDAYTGNGLQGVMVTIRPAAGNRILKVYQDTGRWKFPAVAQCYSGWS